jgi:hypothetical protein
VSGTLDSKDVLTLTSSKLTSGGIVHIKLLSLAILGSAAEGTAQVTGGSCPCASSHAFGTQFPSVTGSFAGNLVPGTFANPGTTGGGSAALSPTQSTTPNPDEQFNVSGSLAFKGGTCSTTTSFAGTISGNALELGFDNLFSGQVGSAVLLAFETTSGTPLTVAEVTFIPGPCSSVTQGGDVYRQPDATVIAGLRPAVLLRFRLTPCPN